MSEQARIAYLQEKLKEARNRKREMSRASYIGIAMSAVFFGLHFSGFGSGWSGLGLGVIGTILAAAGWYGEHVQSGRVERWMQELRDMSMKTPKCPKCAKELPEGDFAFCPHCGAALGRE